MKQEHTESPTAGYQFDFSMWRGLHSILAHPLLTKLSLGLLLSD